MLYQNAGWRQELVVVYRSWKEDRETLTGAGYKGWRQYPKTDAGLLQTGLGVVDTSRRPGPRNLFAGDRCQGQEPETETGDMSQRKEPEAGEDNNRRQKLETRVLY